MKIIKSANYKKSFREFNDFESSEMGSMDRTEDLNRVQLLIDKYNQYETDNYYVKESAPGSEFYSLLSSENGVIVDGDLLDIEERMKQIIRENGIY